MVVQVVMTGASYPTVGAYEVTLNSLLLLLAPLPGTLHHCLARCTTRCTTQGTLHHCQARYTTQGTTPHIYGYVYSICRWHLGTASQAARQRHSPPPPRLPVTSPVTLPATSSPSSPTITCSTHTAAPYTDTHQKDLWASGQRGQPPA